jgi:hypothetical protein
VSLNPRAIATLGVGFGATAVAYLGLWPVGTPPVEPPVPPAVFGGFAAPSLTVPGLRISRDDRDLLELVPILVEVINGRR